MTTRYELVDVRSKNEVFVPCNNKLTFVRMDHGVCFFVFFLVLPVQQELQLTLY